MLIRWLGAFGKASSLEEAFKFEFSDNSMKCAEHISKEHLPKIKDPIVGLLVKSKALIRKFKGDVWSFRPSNSIRLKASREEGEAYSTHKEAWVRPKYCGIVIKSRNISRYSKDAISQDALLAIMKASKKYSIPVYRLTKGGTLEEVILMKKVKRSQGQ